MPVALLTAVDLLAAKRALLAAKLADRATAKGNLDALRAAFEADQTSVTDAEIISAGQNRNALDAEIDVLNGEISALDQEVQRDQAMDRLAIESSPALGAVPLSRGARVPAALNERAHVLEKRTYSKLSASNNRAPGFFTDAWRARTMDDFAARSRIEAHQNECLVEREGTPLMVERATTTGSYAGLVIPQYLIDMNAPVLRFGRPLANVCNRHELTEEGMSLLIPRQTTGSSTAIQATENAIVSLTDQVWTNLTVPVVTIAGQAAVSRQSLERGTGLDDIIFGDLARAYAANLDNQVINGTGTGGQMLGILNTASINAATAYGAVITPALWALKVAGQITAVTSAGAGLWPKIIALHPRRWGWATSQVDSSGRPIVLANPAGPFNAMGVISSPGAYGGDPDPVTGATIVGVHSSGLPVITDLNLPSTVGTNSEDISLVLDTEQMHLWEDGDGMPRELRFEQTAGANLTTTLIVYGYAAFTAGRYPAAVGKIGGLDSTATFGQVAPSF